MKEEEKTVKCYQCKRKESTAGNELFPFCSEKCKKAWGDENWGKSTRRKQKYHTIEECQKRLVELAEEKNPAPKLI